MIGLWTSIKTQPVLASSHVRLFSSSSFSSRIYAHVVRRRVRHVDPVQVGDPKLNCLREQARAIPQYPYGDSTVYKQSNRGLYGGRVIQFGNKLSDFGNRNMRTFKPNVHWNKLWSEVLNKQINIRVVASVLKTITKEGGIDNYLIKDKPARVKELGPMGWKLRYQVLKKLEKKEAQDKTRPKPIKVVEGNELDQSSSGDIPVYAEYQSQSHDTTYLITVGRTRLLKNLFGQLKSQGAQESYKEFISVNKGLTIEETLERLESTGYDLSLVSYKP